MSTGERKRTDIPWDFDPWASVPWDDLPTALVSAFKSADWESVGGQLRELMDGVTTDGPYGRQLIQLVRKLPLGIDPLFDRYRAVTAIDYGDWQDLQRCLARGPLEASELEGIRDIWLAPIDQRERPADAAPHRAAMFALHELQLSRDCRRHRKLVRIMLANRFADITVHRPDMPTNRHLLYRTLQDAVLLSVAETNGGRLSVALSVAREGQRLGNEGEQLRTVAVDLEELIEWAMGRAGEPEMLTSPRQISSNVGASPLGTWEQLGHLLPLISLVPGQWLEWTVSIIERIGLRMGSPRAELQVQSWRVAAELLSNVDTGRNELPSLLVRAHLAPSGLRLLPQLLDGFAQPRHSAFAEALESARRAGNVWGQISALCWMTALNPTPWTTRALRRLLDVTGWRRIVLVPPEIAAEAALGLCSAGQRAASVVELASASERPNVVLEVASRHLKDDGGDGAAAAVRALSRLGTARARELLESLARRRNGIGDLARVAVARPTSHSLLSEREKEVLRLAAKGLTNKEIGAHLTLSEHTIARHIANARNKLGAANRAEAVSRLAEMSRS